MTLAQVRRLSAGDHAFYQGAIWRVASPALVRRRGGYRVRLEAASGVGGAVLEVRPSELAPFGRLRRMTAANRLLAGSSPPTRAPRMTEPRAFATDETPAEHVANAAQLVLIIRADLEAVEQRLAAALALLAKPRS